MLKILLWPIIGIVARVIDAAVHVVNHSKFIPILATWLTAIRVMCRHVVLRCLREGYGRELRHGNLITTDGGLSLDSRSGYGTVVVQVIVFSPNRGMATRSRGRELFHPNDLRALPTTATLHFLLPPSLVVSSPSRLLVPTSLFDPIRLVVDTGLVVFSARLILDSLESKTHGVPGGINLAPLLLFLIYRKCQCKDAKRMNGFD